MNTVTSITVFHRVEYIVRCYCGVVVLLGPQYVYGDQRQLWELVLFFCHGCQTGSKHLHLLSHLTSLSGGYLPLLPYGC